MTYENSLILTGDAWHSLTDEEKIEVLQTIETHMAYEAGRMVSFVEGIPINDGSDGIVLGKYDPNEGLIYINSSQFASDAMYGKDSSMLVLATLHEGRHAYQHQVADGLIEHEDQDETMKWQENFHEGNYITFEENPKGYYEQPVEVDARNFAAERYKELESERLEALIDHSKDYYEEAKTVFETQMNESPSENYCSEAYDHESDYNPCINEQDETNGLSF